MLNSFFFSPLSFSISLYLSCKQKKLYGSFQQFKFSFPTHLHGQNNSIIVITLNATVQVDLQYLFLCYALLVLYMYGAISQLAHNLCHTSHIQCNNWLYSYTVLYEWKRRETSIKTNSIGLLACCHKSVRGLTVDKITKHIRFMHKIIWNNYYYLK